MQRPVSCTPCAQTNPANGLSCYFMLFKAGPFQLSKLLPMFPPVNDADIDNLIDLNLKMSMYNLHTIHIHIIHMINTPLMDCLLNSPDLFVYSVKVSDSQPGPGPGLRSPPGPGLRLARVSAQSLSLRRARVPARLGSPQCPNGVFSCSLSLSQS